MSFIPECDKCGSEKHDGLRPVCDNTEKQEVLNVCDDCYKKTTPPEYTEGDLVIDMQGQMWYIAVVSVKVHLLKVNVLPNSYRVLKSSKRQAKITKNCGLFSYSNKPDCSFWTIKHIPKNEQLLPIVY